MDEQIVREQEKTEELVRQLLNEDERCRNNDLWLILQIWQNKQHIKLFVPYNQMGAMITPETITRVRRKIQNTEGILLPTNPEVIHKRKVKELVLRAYYSQRQDIVRAWEEIAYKIR